MLVKQANSFKAIDDLLENQKDPTILTQLFNKKQRMLEMIDAGKLTFDKYLLICKKIVVEATIQKIKDSTEMEMIALDENAQAWFKDVIDQTKDKMEDQKKIIIKTGGKIQQKVNSNPKIGQKESSVIPPEPKTQKKSSIKESQLRNSKQSTQQLNKTQTNSTAISSSIEPAKIFSLKVLDSLMDENGGNKQLYMSLFQQKEKLLKIIAEKKLNAQSYFQNLQKSLKIYNNQDINIPIQMQLDELNDYHSGNVQSWFKDRLQQTEEEKEKQKQKYSVFKTGKAATMPKKPTNDGIDPDVESITANISEKVKKNKVATGQYQMSLRYLDEQMQKYEEDKTKYCELFEEKLKLFDKLKNGELDAQGYRDMLAEIIQESSNEQLSEAAKMQVDLHDLTGDVNQFFQSSINDSGQKFQEQQKKYNQFTGGKGAKLKLPNSTVKKNETTCQIEMQIPQEIKPDITDIVSFTVLVQFLDMYKKDYDYCVQLKQKGGKLMKLVQEKKLAPNQYIKFLQAKIPSAKDKETVTIMKKQLQKFKQSKDANKQFKTVLGQYLNKVKVDLGNRGTYDSQVQINEITIDSADNNTKIQFLLRKLSKYQSLLAYYKNNKLQKHAKQFDPQYQAAKKKTLVLCDKLRNNDAKDIDIHAFIDENLPPVTFGVLHRESKASYNEKLNAVIEKIRKSSAKITEYMKALKKGSNKSNIQESGKMIDKNNKMIAYLQNLKNEDLIPFPQVQEVKIQMYNLDFNKNLTENQIQIIVSSFQGIHESLTFQIFMIDKKAPRFQAKVTDGPQNKIDVIIKIPPEIMQQIIKGTDKKYLNFKLVSKGWFSDKIVADADLQLNFIRSNKMEDNMPLKQDKIFLSYTINVLKPKKPIITEIPTIKLTEYPKYEDNKFVEKQFIKTIMPFEKPTQSEVNVQ